MSATAGEAPRASPSAGATRHLVQVVARARQAFGHGSLDVAGQLCEEVLELAPDHPDALDTLYRVHLARGEEVAAEALLRRIVAIHPNGHGQVCDLALLLLQRGELAEAERHARNAVRLAPEHPQSHNLMGLVLTEAQRPHLGEFHYRRVLELTDHRDPVLLANLAWALARQGRLAEARTLYEESTAAAPEVVQTWLGWARMEEMDRAFGRAVALLDRADALVPDHRGVLLARAVLAGRLRDDPGALAALDRAAVLHPGPDIDEKLERGSVLDRMGRHAEAFACFDAGKAAERAGGRAYRSGEAEDLAGRLRSFFVAPRLAFTPRAAVRDDEPQPIFVLGFPRSGTTLVEQTLSAHPRISAGDELPLIGDLAASMPRLFDSPFAYPEALSELWMADKRNGLDLLRDEYLRGARQLGAMRPGAAWFTDKMPLNEVHLGLMALLFPRSPLVHVVRHPLDSVLSTFSHRLTHGFDCALALESTARHYVLAHELVTHYRTEMTLRFLTVRYEDMVDDQENSVRRLLAFIGEEYDPRCLAFHENRRLARTASYAQVTEKLHDRARHRYRNYLKQLAPVIPMLEPIIEQLGYAV